MKLLKRSLLIVLILMGSMALAAPLQLTIASDAIPEPVQMLLLGLGLVVLAGYGRRKLYRK